MKTMMLAAILVTQTAGSQAPQSTGYSECDKYIQMVTACINTKVPPSVRPDRQKELDAFRNALSFIPGSVASKQCAENIRLEIQRDRYGCYAAQAAIAGVPTPCSLVTRADLQQIVPAAYTEGQPGNSKCTFAPADGAPRPVTIEVRSTGGREALEHARALAPPAPGTRSRGANAVVAGKTIKGLGDDAFLLQAGLMPMLHVRKGETAVLVMAPVTEEQLTAIARKALERLPR